MLSQGVQPRVLQDVLGHSDIRMTLGTYGHVIREQKKEDAQKVDAFLATSPVGPPAPTPGPERHLRSGFPFARVTDGRTYY